MKQNIGKIVMQELQNVQLEGLKIFDFSRKRNLPYLRVREVVEKFERRGKVECLTDNKYVLTKYLVEEKYKHLLK